MHTDWGDVTPGPTTRLIRHRRLKHAIRLVVHPDGRWLIRATSRGKHYTLADGFSSTTDRIMPAATATRFMNEHEAWLMRNQPVNT